MTFFPKILSSTPGAFPVHAGAEPSPGYRLREVRGRGGFAEVWEAAAPSGSKVALKFMPSSNAGSTARELRSIQSFTNLDHPYLVKTHTVYSVPGYIVVEMELAEGTLLDFMQVYHHEVGNHLEPATICMYLWQIAEALDFLNARKHVREGRKVGFQHGDVKPNNILLFGDVAKLTDYGLSTPTHGPSTPCPRHGTKDYAAPEVFQGNLTDTSDQYSLAVTYCVLRTGKFPFQPVTTDTPRSSCLRPAPEVPGALPAEQAALSRALSLVPQARYPTCIDLMDCLIKAHGLDVHRTGDGHVEMIPLTESRRSIQTKSKLIVDLPSPSKSKPLRDITPNPSNNLSQ